MPSEGGQSTKTTSNRCDSSTGRNACVTRCRWLSDARQLDVRAAQIDFAGDHCQALEGGVLNLVQQAALAQQREVGAGARRLFQAHAAGRVGLRVEVEQQHAPADRGDTGGQIDRRGRLADAAFLVGDGDDFGWHAGGLAERSADSSFALIQVLRDGTLSLAFIARPAASYRHELDPFDP